ncbi:MAG: C-terminal binding protein [Anaerolineae bacterium]|nr:C-terminal binding protein [Anaerolineae bacterium]
MKPKQWQVAITDDIQTYHEIVRNLNERLGADIEIVPAVTRTPQEFIASTRRCHALVGGDYQIGREVIEQLECCLIIAQNGVGYDHIDLEAAGQQGIRVTNVPDYGSGEVAVHALTLMLALARRLPMYDKIVRAGCWDKLGAGKILRLSEATLGILGLGRIGRSLAKQASALECRIIASDPYVPVEVFAEYNVKSVDLPTLVTESDYLALCANYTPETHHLIGANEFAQMKSTTVLVNTARGKLMDEQALIEALKSRQIAAAGLDVFTQEPLPLDSPLRTLDNVILTPHAAWYSVGSLRAQAARTANEVTLALTGKPSNYALVDPPLLFNRL